jgi:hypothetical protein
LEKERLRRRTFATHEQARGSVFQYIEEFCNRLQVALDAGVPLPGRGRARASPHARRACGRLSAGSRRRAARATPGAVPSQRYRLPSGPRARPRNGQHSMVTCSLPQAEHQRRARRRITSSRRTSGCLGWASIERTHESRRPGSAEDAAVLDAASH